MYICDKKINMGILDTTFLKKQMNVLDKVIAEQEQIEGCYNDKIDALVGLKTMCENILEQCDETPANLSVEFFAS
jgi:hypothetical protein|tara:strand:- start:183 stop:407 length:225 start_codon:yes stop_codon:yes gene_type:complete